MGDGDESTTTTTQQQQQQQQVASNSSDSLDDNKNADDHKKEEEENNPKDDIGKENDKMVEEKEQDKGKQEESIVGEEKRKLKRKINRPCSPTHFANMLEVTNIEENEKNYENPQRKLNSMLHLVSKQLYTSTPKDVNGTSLKLKLCPELKNGIKLQQQTSQGNSKKRKLSNSQQGSSSNGTTTTSELRLVGLQHHSTLGALVSPLYRPTVEELWAPREIAIFESAICMYGKKFHSIQKLIPTKTTQQVIDYFYVWKKTPNYKQWKKHFIKQ